MDTLLKISEIIFFLIFSLYLIIFAAATIAVAAAFLKLIKRIRLMIIETEEKLWIWPLLWSIFKRK